MFISVCEGDGEGFGEAFKDIGILLHLQLCSGYQGILFIMLKNVRIRDTFISAYFTTKIPLNKSSVIFRAQPLQNCLRQQVLGCETRFPCYYVTKQNREFSWLLWLM